MLSSVEKTLFDGTPDIVRAEVDRTMGMDLFFGNSQLSDLGKVGILIAIGVFFILLSTICLSLSKKKDR